MQTKVKSNIHNLAMEQKKKKECCLSEAPQVFIKTLLSYFSERLKYTVISDCALDH